MQNLSYQVVSFAVSRIVEEKKKNAEDNGTAQIHIVFKSTHAFEFVYLLILHTVFMAYEKDRSSEWRLLFVHVVTEAT